MVFVKLLLKQLVLAKGPQVSTERLPTPPPPPYLDNHCDEAGDRGHSAAEDAARAAGSAFFLTSLPRWLLSVSYRVAKLGKLMQQLLVTKKFRSALASVLDQRAARDYFLTAMVFLPIVYQIFIIKKKGGGEPMHSK